MDKCVEYLPRVVRGLQAVVEGLGDRPGRASARLILVGKLPRREALEQHAAHDQCGKEAQAERKKQLCSE